MLITYKHWNWCSQRNGVLQLSQHAQWKRPQNSNLTQIHNASLAPSAKLHHSSKLDLDGARNNIHAKKGNVGFDCTQQREEDPGAENSLNTATNLSKEGGLRYRQKKSIQERSPERSPVQAKPRQLRGTDKSKGPRIEEGSGRTVVGSLRCCEGGDGTKSEASIRRRRETCGFFFLFFSFFLEQVRVLLAGRRNRGKFGLSAVERIHPSTRDPTTHCRVRKLPRMGPFWASAQQKNREASLFYREEAHYGGTEVAFLAGQRCVGGDDSGDRVDWLVPPSIKHNRLANPLPGSITFSKF